MLDRIEINRLEATPIEGLAEQLGIRVERHKALCPWHDDSRPSLTFDTRKNRYRCYVCGEHGGVIDLVMQRRGCGFREACTWLNAFGIKPNPGTTMPYLDITPSTFACDEDCEYYNQIIDTAEVHHPCKGEAMFTYQPQYNYGIETDFNKERVYPNGSAIFVHVKGTKQYTGGCIAFDEDKMIEILRNCDQSLVITVRK